MIGGPEDACLGGDGLTVAVSAQYDVFVGEASQRLQQVELAGVTQLIQAAQTAEHLLSHVAVDALVLHQEQVRALAVSLCAEEQASASLTLQ